ncbi:hypothetical protein TYRP_014619 [Tyrophagus putrescentiae]|nr:hypothetical protein TYRP_014619 [Tyrophagus putrescentiae]
MRPSTYRLIVLCTVANFINSADRAILPIAIIQMAEEYNWTLAWQGWILSSFSYGYITSQIIGSAAASRFGAGNILTLSVLIWSMSMLITPLVASNLLLLIPLRILLGLGEGLGLPMIFQLFAANVPVSERSRAFGYLISAGTVGQTVAALLTPHLYWSLAFYKFGALGIVWTYFWFAFYYRGSGGGFTDESRSKTIISLEAPSINGGGESEAPLIIGSSLKSSSSSFPGSGRWYRSWWTYAGLFLTGWPLWAIYIAHFAMNWSNYIIMQWFPYYLSRYLGADSRSLSLTAVPYIVNSIAGIGAGHIADSLITERKWPLLRVRRLMTAVGLAGAGLCMLTFATVRSLLPAVSIIVAAMAFCALNSAGHLANHSDVAPAHAGITFAVSNTLATIPGLLCGPLTAELVLQSSGRFGPVFVLAAAINAVGAVVYASQSSATPIF